MSSVQVALQRCLNSPYLYVDETKRLEVHDELALSQKYYGLAEASYAEDDESSALKQVWGAMYHAARALVFMAGYKVDQLRCLEIVLLAHYPAITEDDIKELRRGQELVGNRDVALGRARQFMNKTESLLQVDQARR
jgi:hypothetical protein